MQFSAPMEDHIGLKEHRNAFIVMKCFVYNIIETSVSY